MSVAECCLLALSKRFTDLDTWNRLTRRAEENICMQSRCAFMCVFRVDQLSDGHEVTGMDCLVAGRGWLPIELLYNIYRVPGSVFFFFDQVSTRKFGSDVGSYDVVGSFAAGELFEVWIRCYLSLQVGTSTP